MENKAKETITIQVLIHAPIQKVWDCFTGPNHIVHWNYASIDWHAPRAENDLRVGGHFSSRMEAKDGSIGFNFGGTYTKVETHLSIEYVLDDDRKVQISFEAKGDNILLTESFEAEQENTIELQRFGWQAILDNFKNYTEALAKLKTLHYEILIDAGTEKVYQKMFEDKNWREWTAPFNPTSYYKGSWEKDSKMLFLGTDDEGNMGGMVSRIKENIPNQFVSIEHNGIIQGDEEILSGPEVYGWAGAMENYTFTETDGKTLLSVDLDANTEFMSYFTETWPVSLEILKTICENK
jgi:uncharacterized protein YndB with AHSA1/START domain